LKEHGFRQFVKRTERLAASVLERSSLCRLVGPAVLGILPRQPHNNQSLRFEERQEVLGSAIEFLIARAIPIVHEADDAHDSRTA
jgi:hypothetical protein